MFSRVNHRCYDMIGRQAGYGYVSYLSISRTSSRVERRSLAVTGSPDRSRPDSTAVPVVGRTLYTPATRCHGLSVYAVCVCNKVRLPGTGQSAHVIGGSRFTRPASNSRRTLLN